MNSPKKIVEESINVIMNARFVGETSSRGPRPLTVFFEDESVPAANMITHPPKLTVKVLSPFPYTDSKMVP